MSIVHLVPYIAAASCFLLDALDARIVIVRPIKLFPLAFVFLVLTFII
jgi:hypothetical protein